MQVQFNQGPGGCIQQIVGLFTCCGCLSIVLGLIVLAILTLLLGGMR